jgi:hypothetical protein
MMEPYNIICLHHFVHVITTQTDIDIYITAVFVLQPLLVHVTLHCTHDYNTNPYNIFVLPRPFMQPSPNSVWPYALVEGYKCCTLFQRQESYTTMVFNYLLAYIRHDIIMHKIYATSFRILISGDLYVSPIPTYTIAQHLLSSPCITNNSSQRCTNLSSTHQKTVVPVHRP